LDFSQTAAKELPPIMLEMIAMGAAQQHEKWTPFRAYSPFRRADGCDRSQVVARRSHIWNPRLAVEEVNERRRRQMWQEWILFASRLEEPHAVGEVIPAHVPETRNVYFPIERAMIVLED
jgi:hypothetical protein